jgi:Xaa-Pro aminopeptidase
MSDPLLLMGASTSNQNLFYKTRFLAGDPVLYVESGASSTLVVPGMEVGRAQKESTVNDVRSFEDLGYVELRRQYGDSRRAMAQMAVRVLREHGVATVRVEPSLPVQFADALRTEDIELVIDARMIVDDRRSKSAEEVAAIEAAQRATERALARAITLIEESEEHSGLLHFNGIPLTSERVRAEIETDLLRENLISEVDSIVAGGPSAADPHSSGQGPFRWGEPIVMDIFPRSRSSRYFADITRTVVKGEPSDTVRAMYEAVMQAHQTALGLVQPGANGADIHRAVLDVFRAAGYDGDTQHPRMSHGTGHGIGLDIHEAPGLGQMDVELVECDVITIEPGLYHPDIGGIRIEDAIVVTPAGFRNLTSMSKRFELGV